MNVVRIGAGAGWSGDRIEPAVELIEKGQIQYIVFECLSERTTSIAQQAKVKDPDQGYDPSLEERMNAVLGPCIRNGVKIISNMGAANPISAVKKILQIARTQGLRKPKVAAVTGDDVIEQLRIERYPMSDPDPPHSISANEIVSANAYLGAEPIVEALAGGAEIVITGRVSDPALFMAPIIHEFKWSMQDWEKLGRGVLVGHMLECAGQITGGFFADPGYKDVAGLARLGFPLAEVREDGSAVLTKVPGSGGSVTTATCKEQLLYEIHDPHSYLQPDVIADFSNVKISQLAPDKVLIEGASGRPRPDTLKVTVCYADGYFGEGQISYAGPGATARAQLALDIVAERLDIVGVPMQETRLDLIGVNSTHGAKLSLAPAEPYEVRARIIARTRTLKDALRIGHEVESLYTNGPAGGGGVMKATKEVLAVSSAFVPRERIKTSVHFVEA